MRDVIERLRAADPLGGAQGDRYLEGQEADDLFKSIVAEDVPEEQQLVRPFPARRKFLVSLGATATAAAVAVAVIATTTPSPDGRSELPVVRGVVGEAALVAGNQEAAVAEPGQYYFQESETQYMNTVMAGPDEGSEPFRLLQSTRSERWFGVDGSGRYLNHHLTTEFISAAEEERWRTAGSPDLGLAPDGRRDERFTRGSLALVSAELPTDPDALYKRLQEEARGHSDPRAELFVLASDHLRAPDATPELRAALFEVIGRVEGLEIVGRVEDPHGRRGTAVAIEHTYTGMHLREELIFDEETSAILAERTVVAGGPLAPEATPPTTTSLPPGTVVGYAVYLDQGVVDSVNERP